MVGYSCPLANTTNYPDLAQLGRAPDLGSGGRVFESLSPDQSIGLVQW